MQCWHLLPPFPSLFLLPSPFPGHAELSVKSSSLLPAKSGWPPGHLGNWEDPGQGTCPQDKEGDAGPHRQRLLGGLPGPRLRPGWGWGFLSLQIFLLPGQPGASCDPHVPGTGLVGRGSAQMEAGGSGDRTSGAKFPEGQAVGGGGSSLPVTSDPEAGAVEVGEAEAGVQLF